VQTVILPPLKFAPNKMKFSSLAVALALSTSATAEVYFKEQFNDDVSEIFNE
jgi:hypothetical protein